MTDRLNIIERIANLRALGEGTTSEAEAMSAMKAADKLMHAYRVSEAELAMAEADGSIHVEIVERYGESLMNGRNRHKVQACLWSIEAYCEVECVLKTRYARGGSDRFAHWIGDRADVEMALWLTDVIREALDREYDRWKRSQQSVGRGAKGSFQTAMAERVNGRLREMRHVREAERRQAVEAATKLLSPAEGERLRYAVANGEVKELTSTALVVASAAEVKRKAVDEAFKAAYAGRRLGTASGFSYGSNGSAYRAGQSAGNRVNLGRPVGQSAGGLLQ